MGDKAKKSNISGISSLIGHAARQIVTAIIIISVLLISGCGNKSEITPNENKTDPAVKEEKLTYSISLPVAVNDTLDPFKAESDVNRSLLTLLYDGLYYIDPDFEAKPLIADSMTVDGIKMRVSLKREATFVDGTPIEAKDIVYSFNEAKRNDYYAARLYNFYTAEAIGSIVEFTLFNPMPEAEACLDFPIVKTGTVEYPDREIQPYEVTPPVGSGRFKPVGDLPYKKLKSTKTSLRGKPIIEEIELYETSGSEGMVYGLEIGNYDFWFNDLSDGTYTRANAGMQDIVTNNLVFLAFNSDKEIFRDANVRNAVSLLIDRNELCAQSYFGHAVPTDIPFNPAWSKAKDLIDNDSLTANTESALTILKSDGYVNINYYGYRSTTTLSLTANLLVCADNEFKLAAAKYIKSNLAAADFNVNIVAMDFENYMTAIKKGEYDMYLGEIKITPDMSLNQFFNAGGAGYTGISGTNCADSWKSYRNGEMGLEDFCAEFETSTPFVPLCYRCGSAISSRRLTSKVTSTCYDGFYNINDWVVTVNEII